MMKKIIYILLSVWLLALPAYAIDEAKLIDMTYSFTADTHHWPTAKPFSLEKAPC